MGRVKKLEVSEVKKPVKKKKVARRKRNLFDSTILIRLPRQARENLIETAASKGLTCTAYARMILMKGAHRASA